MVRAENERPDVAAKLALGPQIRLHGTIDDAMLKSFLCQLPHAAGTSGPLAIELTTLGGDAEIGRRIAMEAILLREQGQRRTIFIGKSAVYSAGATIMGGFAKADRYLTRDCILLLHCRTITKTLELQGPLGAVRAQIQQMMSQIEMGVALQSEGYARIIEGSEVSMEEVEEKAQRGWYLRAHEALERGLVAGLV